MQTKETVPRVNDNVNIYEKAIMVTFQRAELEEEQWEDIKKTC